MNVEKKKEKSKENVDTYVTCPWGNMGEAKGSMRSNDNEAKIKRAVFHPPKKNKSETSWYPASKQASFGLPTTGMEKNKIKG